MSASFFHSFQSEWLKTRNSLASWLVLLGGFFIPAIMLAVRIIYAHRLPKDSVAPDFWEKIFSNCWQSMAIFLLPMGIVLSASLITQIEFRNNSWKQLHTTPQHLTTIFTAKLSVIIVMLLQLFILFNVGIYLAGILPHVFFRVDLPGETFPLSFFLEKNTYFFVACLPIVALQYLISLQFKNFLVPLGIGLGLLVASLIAVEWKYGYVMPYSYCPSGFLGLQHTQNVRTESVDLYAWAMGYFVLFTVASYTLYITQKEKG